MKLIDIVKKLPWPNGAVSAEQNSDGAILWLSEFDVREIYDATPADDYATAIITHADWLAAKEQVEPKEREPGFYWVRILSGGEWVVCWWNGYCFDSTHNQEFRPSEVEVNERRIVRQP